MVVHAWRFLDKRVANGGVHHADGEPGAAERGLVEGVPGTAAAAAGGRACLSNRWREARRHRVEYATGVGHKRGDTGRLESSEYVAGSCVCARSGIRSYFWLVGWGAVHLREGYPLHLHFG